MDKILVTGGSGFIGSNLVKRLIQEGFFVRVFDSHFRGSPGRLQNVKDQIQLHTGDIRDPEAVDKACQGMDIIFHLACINGTRYFYEMPETVLEVAVKGALNTLDSAIRRNVKKYILASSSEVYHEPTLIPTPETERSVIPDIKNPRYSYAGGKLISELLTVHYGEKNDLETTVFRPHNIYGPDMGYEHVIPEFILRMRNLIKSSPDGRVDFPIQGSGFETRSFCYIDDLVDGLMILLHSKAKGDIYHIGDDAGEITIAGLAEKIGSILKARLNIVHMPLQPGGTPRRCPCIDKIRGLGFNPKVSLDEGLRRTTEWYLH